MRNFFWRLRAALWYKRLTAIKFSFAWSMAGGLVEAFAIADHTPEEAVREDLSYWTD